MEVCMPRLRRSLVASFAARVAAPIGVAALIASVSLPSVAQGQAQPNMMAITANNQLIRFNGTAPGTVSSTVAITGLQSGEMLHGLDVRPANGRAYAVGSTGRIYTIDPMSGAAAQSGTGTLSLTGMAFGVDFNPVPDRLRVSSDGEQNLRINVETLETTVDGDLKYAPGDANASANPMVVASGYTNSMAGATATALYVIDSDLDILAKQDPPNDGVLNTIGELGVDVTEVAGFDIAPDGNMAFAALNMAGGSATDLYSIDLNSGAATRVGPIGGGQPIRGLAAILPMPAPGAMASPAPAPAAAAPAAAAPAAKPAGQPAPAAKPAGAPAPAMGSAQMPAALPRTGEAEDQTTWLAGMMAVGAVLLMAGAGLVTNRRRS